MSFALFLLPFFYLSFLLRKHHFAYRVKKNLKIQMFPQKIAHVVWVA